VNVELARALNSASNARDTLVMRSSEAATRAATPPDGTGSRCTGNAKTQAEPKEWTDLNDSRHG
jgi:hypothetical protein